MTKNIIIVPYDPEWPQKYILESQCIQKVLGSNFIAIHHVGSTAVPGMKAKPIIDIILVLTNSESSIRPLAGLGYEYKGEYNIPMRRYFNKEGYNLHVYEEGHSEIQLNLVFRDYLRSHLEAITEYIQVKESLLKDPNSFRKSLLGFTGYNYGKDEFIRKTLERADYKLLRITRCMHIKDLKAAKQFRSNLPTDLEETLFDPAHAHILLSQGSTPIGYAHILTPLSELPIPKHPLTFAPKHHTASSPEHHSTSIPEDQLNSISKPYSTSIPEDQSSSLPEDQTTSIPVHHSEATVQVLLAPEQHLSEFKKLLKTWLTRFLHKTHVHFP